MDNHACTEGQGADACPDLHLPTHGRQRRTREALPRGRVAGDATKGRLQSRLSRRAEGAPTAPDDREGAVGTAEGRSGAAIAHAEAQYTDSGDDNGGPRHCGVGGDPGGRTRWHGHGVGGTAESVQADTRVRGDQVSGRTMQTKKTRSWTDLALENALNSITDDGMSIREASKLYGIPNSSIRDHLYGRTTSRQKGIRPVLTCHEENKIVDYVFKMQDRGHPLTAVELRLKVATATQTRSTSWNARGVPGKGWLRRFRSRHPEISSRCSQGLEIARARALCPISAESLYANLERLYTTHSYPPTHIWNYNESGVQAGRAGGAIVLARRGSRSVHSIEPDQKEHLSVLSCVNADGGCISNFYILKGCYFLQDYIANYEEGAVMGMQPNAWMTRWLFESWISHFMECLKRGPGVDLRNRHLLILDGHNSHVTLEVVKISMESGLDIVSLPSHTSHALQPLDIACFKPFKTAFRQIRDVWCLRNKNLPVGKQTLCEWTSTALKL